MKENYTYQELQDVAYAVIVACREGYLPDVLAERSFVINNQVYLACMYLDCPDDPYFELYPDEGEDVLSGHSFDFTNEPMFDDLLNPDTMWYLSNRDQIVMYLQDHDEDTDVESVEKALIILEAKDNE